MGDAQADAGHAQRGVPGTAEVAAFWAWAEGSLFSSSLERKYLGFMLFGLLLPSLRWGGPTLRLMAEREGPVEQFTRVFSCQTCQQGDTKGCGTVPAQG